MTDLHHGMTKLQKRMYDFICDNLVNDENDINEFVRMLSHDECLVVSTIGGANPLRYLISHNRDLGFDYSKENLLSLIKRTEAAEIRHIRENGCFSKWIIKNNNNALTMVEIISNNMDMGFGFTLDELCSLSKKFMESNNNLFIIDESSETTKKHMNSNNDTFRVLVFLGLLDAMTLDNEQKEFYGIVDGFPDGFISEHIKGINLNKIIFNNQNLFSYIISFNKEKSLNLSKDEIVEFLNHVDLKLNISRTKSNLSELICMNSSNDLGFSAEELNDLFLKTKNFSNAENNDAMFLFFVKQKKDGNKVVINKDLLKNIIAKCSGRHEIIKSFIYNVLVDGGLFNDFFDYSEKKELLASFNINEKDYKVVDLELVKILDYFFMKDNLKNNRDIKDRVKI